MLKTKRLQLIPPSSNYAKAIVDYYDRNQEHLKQFEPLRSDKFYTIDFWDQRIKEILSLMANDQQVSFLITPDSDSSRVIGIINFTSTIRGVFQACYLGYSLDKEWEGQGIMTESLRSAIAYMFKDKNYHRIMANCMAGNIRSLNLLDRFGFIREGVAKDYLYINGQWEDHIMTALINDSWQLPK